MSNTPWKVGYASDLEGSYSYWRRYIEQSSVLFTTDGNDIKLRDNCYFVCGGDVCDRGDGDIRILTDLLALKDEYKEHIQFILGNRDINKLRLPFSLHAKALEEDPYCFWVDPKNAQEFATEKTRAGRMKWILKNSMGSPWSFQCRTEELAMLGRVHDDEAVAQSYLDLIAAPNGLLYRYIEQGKMAVIIGDTIFVHGGINESHLGYIPPRYNPSVPSLTEPSEYCSHPLEWVVKINDFAGAELADYTTRTQPYLASITTTTTAAASQEGWDKVGNYAHPQPGSRLVQCGMGSLADNSPNPSVIYTNFISNGTFSALQPRVISWLQQANINKVIVGHQPAGDCPAILLSASGGSNSYAVSADTCYSSFVQYDITALNNIWTSSSVTKSTGELGESSADAKTTGESSADAKTAGEPATIGEDWKSVTPILRSKGLLTPIPTDVVPTANDKADTRAPLCITEPVVVFDTAPRLVVSPVISAVASTDAAVASEGKIVLKGVLASGHVHGVTLPEPVDDAIIGKEIGNGWIIRSRGIYPSRHPLFISSSSTTAADASSTAGEEEEWCVAGYCEKTTFRSRLLPVRQAKGLMLDASVIVSVKK